MPAFEVVLIVLGVILFFVLIGMLINGGASSKVLVPLFLLVVVMIGYHSIRKVEYKDGAITIEKFATDVLASPQDATRVQQFNTALNQPGAYGQLTGNANARTQVVHALCMLASAKTITKEYAAAQGYVDKARAIDPTSPDVQFAADNIITSKAYDDEFRKAQGHMNRDADAQNRKAYNEFKQRSDQQQAEMQKRFDDLKKKYNMP